MMADERVPGLPYAHLNLRQNPFGEFDLSERAELAVVEVESVVARLARPGFAIQILGDCGRGKTTHLLAILRHFPAARYVHVGEGESPRFPPSDPLFVDEIQRVSRIKRRRLFRRGVSVAIGTHRDVRDELVEAGLDVKTVRVGESLRPERLRRILNRRIEWVRRDDGAVPTVRLDTARNLLRRFGTDIRAVEGHLYEIFQQLSEVQDV